MRRMASAAAAKKWPRLFQVRRHHRVGLISSSRDDNFLGKAGAAVRRVIAIPGDLVLVEGGRQDVYVAVAVQVRRRHRLGPVGGGADGAQGEGGDGRPVVLVPGDLVVEGGGGQDVEVAIPVQVRHRHRVGSVGGGTDGAQREGGVGGPVVLVPGDLAVVVGGGEDVEVAVAVEVRRRHRDGPV